MKKYERGQSLSIIAARSNQIMHASDACMHASCIIKRTPNIKLTLARVPKLSANTRLQIPPENINFTNSQILDFQNVKISKSIVRSESRVHLLLSAQASYRPCLVLVVKVLRGRNITLGYYSDMGKYVIDHSGKDSLTV